MYQDIYNDFSNESFDYFNLNNVRYYFDSKIEFLKEIPLGDTDTIEIPIFCSIKIRDIDLIATEDGREPTSKTAGEVGSCFYNICNFKKWECINIKEVEDVLVHTWEEKVFNYNKNSKIIINLPSSFYNNKTIEIEVFNFRYESIAKFEFEAAETILFDLSREVVDNYFNKRGSYYCSVRLLSEGGDLTNTAISPQNFIISII